MRGKVVAITGAGRGIGLATAARFADAGAIVVIGDLDDDVAAKAAAQVGGGAEGYVVDVADRESFAAFLDRAEALGPVEVLVNNAGIMPLSPLVDQSDASIDKVLDINLRGVITGTRLAARAMGARGHGHVVNVASAVGRIGMAGGAVYSASKFGVVGFSEAMAGELLRSIQERIKKKGVRIGPDGMPVDGRPRYLGASPKKISRMKRRTLPALIFKGWL